MLVAALTFFVIFQSIIAGNHSTIQLQNQELKLPLKPRFKYPNPNLCPENGLRFRLFIIIFSAPNNFNKRQLIRDTWARTVNHSYAFLLAASDKDQALLTEAKTYGDIIQADFIDSYQNLTMKSISMLGWVYTYCPMIDFVFKTDDDTYVNILPLINLLDQITTRPCARLIYGFLFRKPRPNRDPQNKHFLSKTLYPDSHYPDYVKGVGYLIASCAVSDLYLAALSTPYIFIEDVFITGLVAEKTKVLRKHIKNFYSADATIMNKNYKSFIVISPISYSQSKVIRKKHKL